MSLNITLKPIKYSYFYVPVIILIEFIYKKSSLDVIKTGGVIICMFDSSAVDHWFDPQPGQTKDYVSGICASG